MILFERDYSIKPKDVDDFFGFRRMTEELPVFSAWDKEKRTLFIRSAAKCAFLLFPSRLIPALCFFLP